MELLVLFVSGPMTGYPEFNWPAFRAATARLRDVGYLVHCPTESGADFEMSWSDCLRLSLRMLLECDAVVTLHGWEESAGAVIEVNLARDLKMTVRPLSYWVLHGESLNLVQKMYTNFDVIA